MPEAAVWFITHPQVAVDPAVEVPQWGLNDIGRSRAAGLAHAPFLTAVTSVWSSTERKAVEAADLFAGAIPRFAREDLGENDRSATGFVPPAEFEQLADAFFAHPDDSVRGWATARSEQSRIIRAVDELLADPRSGDGDVVIVAHGGVGTLLLCHLLHREIDRSLDQPGQGHVFAFGRATREVLLPWTPLEQMSRSRAALLGGRWVPEGIAMTTDHDAAFDPAAYLEDVDDVMGYLQIAVEESAEDPTAVPRALGVSARSGAVGESAR